jgi:phage-related protein
VPDSRSLLEIVVDVKNAATGAGQLRDVGKAAGETGKGADSAGGKLKNLAVAAGGLIAVKKGADFMRSAVDASTTLAKSTAQLTRTTGMDTQTASAWVSMARQRGIEVTALTRSFTSFSKQMRGVEQGSKTATKAFNDLGISAEQLKGMNTDQAIMATADAFQRLPAGADKAAIAQQLFGRQAQQLLPLLNLGSEGLQEQMDIMKKHGLTMDEAGIKKGLELAKTQREMRATTEGLKVSIGTALMPAVSQLSGALLSVIAPIAQLLTSVPGLGTAVVVLATGIAALIAIVKIATVVQTAFNIAMTANPIGLVILALVALGAGLVIAYNKVSWFRDGVNAAFNAIKKVVTTVVDFVKSHWKTIGTVLLALTGPIGLVIAAFLKFKDQIFGVVDAVIGKIKGIVDAVTDVAGKIANVASDVGGGIVGAAKSVIPGMAYGGVAPAGGTLALVGERGPELMQLPGGTRVTPLQAGTPQPVDFGGLGFGEIHVHLDVEGRELAHVVARETDIQKNRR